MGGITKNQHLLRLVNQGQVDPCMRERGVYALDEDEKVFGVASKDAPTASTS
jgi:hypothetical protein